jgi:hypothetical protein
MFITLIYGSFLGTISAKQINAAVLTNQGTSEKNNNISNITSTPNFTKTKNSIGQSILNQGIPKNENINKGAPKSLPEKGIPKNENINKGAPKSQPEKRIVSVQLDSITVHNDRDGFGEGEFANYVYVQGKQINLNMDVNSGQTINFTPDKQVTVALGENIPLSVFTVGIERDACDPLHFGASLSPLPPPENLYELQRIFKDPNLDWWHAVEFTQDKIIRDNLAEEGCSYNELGRINEFYDPPNYVGSEPNCYSTSASSAECSVLSSNSDFTLRYRINVGPLQ